jgi:hypothetical protein
MNDPLWCQAEIERQKDRVLEMARHERLATEYRQEVMSIWDDRAGKEIRVRYFEPFGVDVGESKRLLREQVDVLAVVVQQMLAAEPVFVDTSTRLLESGQLRQQIEIEVEKSDRAATISRDAVAEVRTGLEATLSLLKKING